jgi:hypothetical protein
MRSIETEGVAFAFTAQAVSAEMGEAFAVVEAVDEAAEAAPAGVGGVA